MAKKKLGIGTIEINKKFGSKEEAFKYAKRLREHIRYICEKKADKGWYAQAMIVISDTRGSTSYVYYEQNGKVGRPKKKIKFSDFDIKYYNGNMNIEWHIHLLLVSKPSYAFRNDIKTYIDSNWSNISSIYEKSIFDLNKVESGVYKKHCNIGIADYFINQSSEILFCDYNFSNEERLKYSLKDYYSEYLKSESGKRRLYAKNRKNQMAEDKYLEELERIESKFNIIERYFYNISEAQDKKEVETFMKRIQLNKVNINHNKVQENHNRIMDDKVPF